MKPSTSGTSSGPSSSSSSSSPSSTAAREAFATWLAAALAAFCAAICCSRAAAWARASSWAACDAASDAAFCWAAISASLRLRSSSSRFLRSSSSCRFFSCRRTACTMRVYFPRVIVRRHVDCRCTTERYFFRCSRFRFSSRRARYLRAVFCSTMARPPSSCARWRSILSTTSRFKRIIVLPRRNCFSGTCMCFTILMHTAFESPPPETSGQMHEKVPMNSSCL
mmetsp:Transcript_68386/g.142567  ORF Transcript_68386/g.142567 Transcript_68386/m.142567 type:complete len:224 (+) Transcript_68386:2196-2867(+)